MMECKRALTDAAGDGDKAVVLLRERGLAKAVKRAGRETSEGTIAMALQAGAAGIVELGCETDFVAKTDDFQALAEKLAAVVLANPEASDIAALAELEIAGEKVAEIISQAIGKLGENIVLKRIAREDAGAGQAGGYIHAGGKLGVIVGLRTEASGERVAALARDVAMHVAAADPSPVGVDRDEVPKALLDKEAEIYRKQAEQEGKPEKVIEKIVEGRIRKYYREVCLLEQAFVKDPERSVQQILADAGKELGSPVVVSGFVRFRLGEVGGA